MLWNGKRSAVSLTFDDGLQCQLDHAVPALAAHDMRATFFLIADAHVTDTIAWKNAACLLGHEIGSHSVSHAKSATLNPRSAFYEAAEARLRLEQWFGQQVYSFCYPFTDAPDFLQRAVSQAGYKQARGGRVARQDKNIVRGDGVNLLNMPCYHINPQALATDLWDNLAEAARRGAWVTLMLHGVGNPADWDNISVEQFDQLLNRLADMDTWVAPFGTVAENFRQYGRR